MASFVDDGWTRDDGFIKPDKMHSGLKFTYRPGTRPEVIRLNDKIEKMVKSGEEDSVKIELLACQFVAERIQLWDLKSSKGVPVPVNPQSCLMMNGLLFGRLYRIVQDLDISDPLPDSDMPPKSGEELLGNL